MTTVDTPTLDQTLALARRLLPHERARLIAVLAEELVVAPAPAKSPDAWARWAALRDDIARTYPDARPSKRLDADRRDRDRALRASGEVDDVHP